MFITIIHLLVQTDFITFVLQQQTKDMESKNITVCIPIDMYDEMLAKDTSISQQLVELGKKDKLIKRLSAIELRGKFTTKEWMAIADAMKDILIEGASRYNSSLLVIEVEDKALYDGLEQKHGINVRNLTEKLSTLTAAQTYALIDKIEYFWSHDGVDSSYFERI